MFFICNNALQSHKGIGSTVRAGAGIKLRQTYKRKAKERLVKRNRLSRRGKRQEAQREQKKLKTYLGRIIRDIERKPGTQGIKGLDQIKRVLEIRTRVKIT